MNIGFKARIYRIKAIEVCFQAIRIRFYAINNRISAIETGFKAMKYGFQAIKKKRRLLFFDGRRLETTEFVEAILLRGHLFENDIVSAGPGDGDEGGHPDGIDLSVHESGYRGGIGAGELADLRSAQPGFLAGNNPREFAMERPAVGRPESAVGGPKFHPLRLTFLAASSFLFRRIPAHNLLPRVYFK